MADAVGSLHHDARSALGQRGGRFPRPIGPTGVDTPFLRGVYERIGTDLGQGLARAAAAVPLGRLPTPDDVAEAALFLASSGARSINGHLLMLDGGASAGTFSPPAGR